MFHTIACNSTSNYVSGDPLSHDFPITMAPSAAPIIAPSIAPVTIAPSFAPVALSTETYNITCGSLECAWGDIQCAPDKHCFIACDGDNVSYNLLMCFSF
eukprot:277297_1